MPVQRMNVPSMAPLDYHLYLAPGARELVAARELPARPEGCVRLVCISDTHNEHEGLQLPEGDVLIHAGDVLTESGKRHVRRSATVQPEGIALFDNFARWFGAQHFAHKVVIGGNHDMVLQQLGSSAVQSTLTQYCSHGEATYLEHREARIGRLRIFGSPYADYSSHNNAFSLEQPTFDLQPGVHVVVTHMPAVLPSKAGPRETSAVATAAIRAGALLHVSGHCHWAHGLHFGGEPPRQLPCVVASVCGASWKFADALNSVSGERGDPHDARFGGYNIKHPCIVCDIAPNWEHGGNGPSIERPATCHGLPSDYQDNTPSLLFFCPPNDPSLRAALLPRLCEQFRVTCVESALEAVNLVSEQPFEACVAKLGFKGNLGYDVIAALRSVHGLAPFVALHSSTAAAKPKLQEQLKNDLSIDLFTEHGREDELLEQLRKVTPRCHGERHQGTEPLSGHVQSVSPPLLFFCPPTDSGLRDVLLPKIRDVFQVTCVEAASEAIDLVENQPFVACIAKLGSKGNLGCKVISALRGAQGRTPFVAIHSATAFADESMQRRLDSQLGIDLFTRHGLEEDLLTRLAPLGVQP